MKMKEEEDRKGTLLNLLVNSKFAKNLNGRNYLTQVQQFLKSKSLDRKVYKRSQSSALRSVRSRSSVSSHNITKASKLSRKQEKDHLQGLNNRLAGYVDKVGQLQTENKR